MRPRRIRRRNYGADRSGMSGAPVSVSSDIQQFTRFSGRGGTLVMHTCAALAELCSDVPADTKGAFADGDSTASAIQLSLTDPAARLNDGTKKDFEFVSPIWDQLASVFVKYTVRSCKLKYMPQAAATNNARMVFAFAEDALHPLVWRAGLKSEELLALSDSMAFMPWKAWEMDVTHKLRKQTFYTYSKDTDQVDFVERLSDFGVIGCVTSGVNATPEKCGVLYLESIVEFEEFCPISNDRPVAGSVGGAIASGAEYARIPFNSSTGVDVATIGTDTGNITVTTTVDASNFGVVTLPAGVYLVSLPVVSGAVFYGGKPGGTATYNMFEYGSTIVLAEEGQTFVWGVVNGTANSTPADSLVVDIVRIGDDTPPAIAARKKGWVTQHVREEPERVPTPQPVVKEDDTGKWMRI